MFEEEHYGRICVGLIYELKMELQLKYLEYFFTYDDYIALHDITMKWALNN